MRPDGERPSSQSTSIAKASDSLSRSNDDGSDRSSPLIHLADRIGALGGSLEVSQTTLRAEIPCA